jgi:hypothetical protein
MSRSQLEFIPDDAAAKVKQDTLGSAPVFGSTDTVAYPDGHDMPVVPVAVERQREAFLRVTERRWSVPAE